MIAWLRAITRHEKNFDYHKYIQSYEWKIKSDAAKERAGYRCQLCGVSGYARILNTHHNTYERLGKELDRDLVVLCDDCHDLFHASGAKPGKQRNLSDSEIKGILYVNGITYTNADPWRFYELGKVIIQHIIDGYDGKLYDRYNKINIELLNAALLNQKRRQPKRMEESSDWEGI